MSFWGKEKDMPSTINGSSWPVFSAWSFIFSPVFTENLCMLCTVLRNGLLWPAQQVGIESVFLFRRAELPPPRRGGRSAFLLQSGGVLEEGPRFSALQGTPGRELSSAAAAARMCILGVGVVYSNGDQLHWASSVQRNEGEAPLGSCF